MEKPEGSSRFLGGPGVMVPSGCPFAAILLWRMLLRTEQLAVFGFLGEKGALSCGSKCCAQKQTQRWRRDGSSRLCLLPLTSSGKQSTLRHRSHSLESGVKVQRKQSGCYDPIIQAGSRSKHYRRGTVGCPVLDPVYQGSEKEKPRVAGKT